MEFDMKGTSCAYRGANGRGVPPVDASQHERDALAAYSDFPGFCKSATTDGIVAHGHTDTLGRHVGAEEVADDGEPFEKKMPRLVAELQGQFAESAKLEKAIKANLRGLGYGG